VGLVVRHDNRYSLFRIMIRAAAGDRIRALEFGQALGGLYREDGGSDRWYRL
jgi:hypothetical protein